jgi:hypothetical protein
MRMCRRRVRMACDAAGGSGPAAQRCAAVVGDNLPERSDDVDGLAVGRAVKLSVGAVQVADDSFGVGPCGEATQVDFPGGVQRAQPPSWPRRAMPAMNRR